MIPSQEKVLGTSTLKSEVKLSALAPWYSEPPTPHSKTTSSCQMHFSAHHLTRMQPAGDSTEAVMQPLRMRSEPFHDHGLRTYVKT